MLIHEAEQCAEVHFVVLAAVDNLIYHLFKIYEYMCVRNVIFGHNFVFVVFVKPSRVLLEELRHIKQTLKVSQGVISLTFIDFTIELALTSSIDTSLIDRDLLCASVARRLSALILT